MKNLLEKIIQDKNYEDLGTWCMPQNSLNKFSETKTLFEYQNQAIKNITKVLHEYYTTENSKEHLFNLYKLHGLTEKTFAIEKYLTKNEKQRNKINSRFLLFQYHFKIENEHEEYIHGKNFINRACFWMATGSGKSLVIIKTIELLDYLMTQKLIPTKEIMILLPREDLIKQLTKEIHDFNKGRSKQIELVNLKKYEEDKIGFVFDNIIKVYYYRSDLLRDERKENILNYQNYLNHGNWYIFLDEAHRGNKEDSLMQDYVTILSKNGFLFNFSATFTDQIDHITTCYNFNLEKFILAGYGKNIYLSPSYFIFTKEKDELSEKEKQKQVLKSLLTFTLVKKSKKIGIYHNPLLITLVNSVNTDDADLLIFFKKLEEIAKGTVEVKLFAEAKNELKDDFLNHDSYIFANEKLKFDSSALENITEQDILEQVFNTQTNGKIEILEGEKGKEIILKLQTTEKPFALIKIGDTGKFRKEQLGNNYTFISSFENKKIFENINQNENINLLLGSRSFYEGWDSNRPNVINMINIGKQDAKKFVLQGIGRGIRIEPFKGERKRLPINHVDKNVLLETLFVYATDKSSIKAIIETVEEQKTKEEIIISLLEKTQKPFDLLIPLYKDEDKKDKFTKFNISKESLKIFQNFINSIDINTLILKTGIPKTDIEFLINSIKDESLFQIKEENIFSDMNLLLYKLLNHITIKRKVVADIKELTDEIIHFKHIKVSNLSTDEINLFKEKIDKVKNFEQIDKKEVAIKFAKGQLTEDEFNRQINATDVESFRDLKIKNIAQHYYVPIIYSEKEKIEYIKHIVNIPSEVNFIKNLEKYIKNNTINSEWMFSKIDQSLDKFYIPYFYKQENIYRNFFPDFVFWIKKDNKYKIVFIDPKGISNAEYQNKIDEFEQLFYRENLPKVFNYKNFSVTFDLKLVTEDVNKIGEKYSKYWLNSEDFDFLNI